MLRAFAEMDLGVMGTIAQVRKKRRKKNRRTQRKKTKERTIRMPRAIPIAINLQLHITKNKNSRITKRKIMEN